MTGAPVGTSQAFRPSRAAAARALLRRELDASLPWLLFFVVGAAVRTVSVIGDDSLAAQYGGHDSGRVLSWILALLCGAAIGDRDARNGATAFLETLPVSPLAFFLARFVVGAVIFVAADLGMVGIGVAAAPAWSSSTATLPLGEIVRIAGASFVSDLCAFCVGLLVAPLRQATGIVAVVVFTVSVVATELSPTSVPFTPGGVGEPHAVGGRIVFVDDGIVFFAFAAALALGLAALFASARSQRGPARAARRGRLVVAVVAAVGALVAWATVPNTTPLELSTRHARFTTVAQGALGPPPSWPQQVEAWRAHVDADLDAVEAAVGARFGRVLRVDVSGQLTGKHGQATGTAIAIDADDAASRFVLVHESVHALAYIVSDGAIADAGDGLEIFSEGLANHVARAIAPDAPPHPDPRPALAGLARQGRLDDRILIDSDLAQATGDPLLVYGIGEELVAAMIDVYGADAPRRFLAQLRPAVDDDVKGVALWHATLARADMLFAPIAARFFARLGAVAPGPAPPLVAVAVEDEGLRIYPVDEFGRDVDDASCRVRSRAADPAHTIVPRCLVLRGELAGGVAEVQVVGGFDGAASRWLRVPLGGARP